MRAAISIVHRIREDAVVAPTVSARKCSYRQQLNEVDAEGAEVVEMLDRVVKRAGISERADLQLVEHRAAVESETIRAVGIGLDHPPAVVRCGHRGDVGALMQVNSLSLGCPDPQSAHGSQLAPAPDTAPGDS